MMTIRRHCRLGMVTGIIMYDHDIYTMYHDWIVELYFGVYMISKLINLIGNIELRRGCRNQWPSLLFFFSPLPAVYDNTSTWPVV